MYYYLKNKNMCNCRFVTTQDNATERTIESSMHVLITLPIICQSCRSLNYQFSYHHDDTNEEEWYQCTDCNSFIMINGKPYKNYYKEIYQFDELDLIVVKEDNKNFIYYPVSEMDIEDPCNLELPGFDFNRENVMQKLKTYTTFM